MAPLEVSFTTNSIRCHPGRLIMCHQLLWNDFVYTIGFVVCAQFTTGTAFIIDGVLVNEISVSPDFPEELPSFF